MARILSGVSTGGNGNHVATEFASGNSLPFRFQSEALNPVLQRCLVELFARYRNHRSNIAQMFFRAAFTIVFQLADNDIFRRCKRNVGSSYRILLRMAKGPGVQFVTISRVKIGLQTGVGVYDVKCPFRSRAISVKIVWAGGT